MLNMSTPLGREVPTPCQVLEVIRPELRLVQVTYAAMHEAMALDLLAHDADYNLTDGGDQGVSLVIFEAIVTAAKDDVRSWARDMHLVFDQVKLDEFIRQALVHAQVTRRELFSPGGERAFSY